MNKTDIITFFDNLAEGWDKDIVRNDEIIDKILNGAGIEAGKTVLDVACGTGVVIPDYLKRGVKSVTAVDISPEMVKVAQSKFPQENVSILCADVEHAEFGPVFDCIVVYNAFPHFPDPERLVKKLCSFLKPGGTLTIAHGMSRAKLAQHHAGRAKNVSIELISETELAQIFETELQVTVMISDDRMYQVTGVKK